MQVRMYSMYALYVLYVGVWGSMSLLLACPLHPWPVQLTVAGYSDGLEKLLMKIVEKMTKLEVDQMKFLMYKDQVRCFVQAVLYM